MVTSIGGENDAQRTWLLGLWAMRQARFLVGERNAPLVVAKASGRTVGAPVVLVVPGSVVLVEPAGTVVVGADVDGGDVLVDDVEELPHPAAVRTAARKPAVTSLRGVRVMPAACPERQGRARGTGPCRSISEGTGLDEGLEVSQHPGPPVRDELDDLAVGQQVAVGDGQLHYVAVGLEVEGGRRAGLGVR